MLAIEDSTSSDWAREMRGTASVASTVMPRPARSSSSSEFCAGATRQTRVAPSCSRARSSGFGVLIANTTSADHGSPSSAPASA